MKIYVHEKGVILVGKAWEIREKLKEYSKDYRLIKEWIELKKTFS
ncbi:Z-ring formation inhibitor MciZ [Bacillus sp. DTU_2020_1000418_1_SI_GHA_SEK_038]|nr:Z-ring formation inhibitor MciZ [Bacillus sp. DTU_2020_1000418_1_SI_GHA_SEK_038]WNS74112.1 Z-ring formation inhibitor MciZ [Bacillus sp. DTU_2020_1000418_1_SI_GHA_SEK_038]